MQRCVAEDSVEKEFMKVFKSLCYCRSSWEVWADVITVIACSLSNAVDKSHFEEREKEYEACIKRLGSVEEPAKLMGFLVMALEKNPNQDFLGAIYMRLDLGSHWKGQFFTPYHVSNFMAKVSLGDYPSIIEEKGYITVNDPTCGAGSMLIAAANAMKDDGINYQAHALFVGQDIDRIVGMMCYIQLSLLGCPGYVVIANTLTNPVCGSILNPIEKEEQEFWYTPLFSMPIWSGRRFMSSLGLEYIAKETEKEENAIYVNPKESFYFFIQINKEEIIFMNEELEKITFKTGNEKLGYEQQNLLNSVPEDKRDLLKQQFELVFQEMIQWCNEDDEFNQLVLQEHKTWERCYKFMEKKAMEISSKGAQSCAIISTTLFEWIKEYYSLDDKDQIENEEKDKKAAAQKRKEIIDRCKKAETTHMSKKKDCPSESVAKETTSLKSKKELEGQFSLFEVL